MARITQKGRELADELCPGPGYESDFLWRGKYPWLHFQEICSLLSRHAKTHHSIQERWCSQEMDNITLEYWERREYLLEKRIKALVKQLNPEIKVVFTGDPRGFTVRLMLPSKRYNTWGGVEFGWGI